MRVMLRAQMDTQLANKAIRSGTLEKLVQSMTEQLKPEATYFGTADGRRTVFVVFDMADSSQLPAVAEPLFEELGARVEVQPVMNLDDVRKGLAAAR